MPVRTKRSPLDCRTSALPIELEYILLTGPTKLFGNEVSKIDGGPSAKHEDRSQILQAEFPNNFVRLRSVKCFLLAAVPDAVFDGIRPLFRLKIPGQMMKFWISKKSPEGWQRKVNRKYKKEDWFLAENWRSMRKNLAHKKHQIAQRNATRHFHVIVQLYYGYETG